MKLVNKDEVMNAVSKGCQEFRGIFGRCEDNINELHSIDMNPNIHLCNSCFFTFPNCPSLKEDRIVSEEGDNICYCNRYSPRYHKGQWIEVKNTKGTTIALRCSICSTSPKNAVRSDFCPNCGADMRGVRDDTD